MKEFILTSITPLMFEEELVLSTQSDSTLGCIESKLWHCLEEWSGSVDIWKFWNSKIWNSSNAVAEECPDSNDKEEDFDDDDD